MSLDLLLALSRAIADPNTALGREVREGLRAKNDLSLEGIELALSEHLETAASAQDRRALESWCEPSERCLVVLSAHVCVAALRAIALALSSAPRVFVRASRRDPVLATILVRELSLRGVAISMIEDLRAVVRAGDQVHAYGSTAALAAIHAALPAAIRFRAHGPGLGAAILGPDADLEHAAAALAQDIVVFDQRGCLSPRVAFIDGEERGVAFAQALHHALSRAAERIPPSVLDASARAERARFRATAQAVAVALHEDRDHIVALVTGLSDLPIPPPARSLLLVQADHTELSFHLRRLHPWLTTLGISDETAASRVANALHPARMPRIALLGLMQRPPLDGPVDRRAEDLAFGEPPTR